MLVGWTNWVMITLRALWSHKLHGPGCQDVHTGQLYWSSAPLPPPPPEAHTLCIYIYFLNSVIFKGGGGARWPCAARALNMIITLFSPGLITVMLSLLALLGFLIKLRVIGCSARCISQVPKSAHISFATSPLATNLQPDSIKKMALICIHIVSGTALYASLSCFITALLLAPFTWPWILIFLCS